MYSFVARQPILDTKQKTVAYELLFRQGLTNAFPKISSEQATTTLISEQFLNQPLESLVGESLAFINFPYSMLVGGVANCLPADKVVIEILEDATPDDVLLKTVKEMKGSHFRLALDDFVMGSEWERFLPYIDVIKFDFRISKHSDIADYIAAHKDQYPKLRYLAEKIETNEEFEEAIKMGCSLFQGYFFSRPEIVRQKALTDNQVTITQLLSEVIRDDIDYDKIEMILNRDISLLQAPALREQRTLRQVRSDHLIPPCRGLSRKEGDAPLHLPGLRYLCRRQREERRALQDEPHQGQVLRDACPEAPHRRSAECLPLRAFLAAGGHAGPPVPRDPEPDPNS